MLNKCMTPLMFIVLAAACVAWAIAMNNSYEKETKGYIESDPWSFY